MGLVPDLSNRNNKKTKQKQKYLRCSWAFEKNLQEAEEHKIMFTLMEAFRNHNLRTICTI